MDTDIMNKYWPLFFLFILMSCRGTDKNGNPVNTPTSGEINIVVDNTLKPIIDAEVDAFEAIYKNAEINIKYTSEVMAIDRFLKDSAVLVILTRKLTEEELSPIIKQKIVPNIVKLGLGAIALIVNNLNPDSVISMGQLRAIFNGEITNWNQLGGNSQEDIGKIQVVFSNPNASTVRYIKDSIAGGKLPGNVYALNSSGKVIDYVSQNKNAMGIIGVSWISDRDDPQALGFLDKIQVMAVAQKLGEESYEPYQAYIAMDDYPLNRNIFMISREARSGLATGFITFVASSKGQRVILKAGLVPATMPVRIIQFKE